MISKIAAGCIECDNKGKRELLAYGNDRRMTKWCLHMMKIMVYYKYKRATAHKVG